MARQIVGLELGTYSIKVVKVESKGRGKDFSLTSFAEQPIGLDFSVSVNRDEIRNAQLNALRVLKTGGHLEGDLFVCGLPSDAAQMQHLEVPFSDAKKVQAVLGGLLDAAVPFDLDELVFPWTFASEQDQPPETKKKKTREVAIAFARKTAIKEHLGLLGEVSIDPRILNIKSLALFELFLSAISKDKIIKANWPDQASLPCYAMVDIGHCSTSVCLMSVNNVLMARSILRGGIDVTKSISKTLNISLNDATKVLTNGKICLEDEAPNKEELAASNAIKKGFGQIERELRQTFLALASRKNYRVTDAILVGGTSQVKNLDHYLSKSLGMSFSLAGEHITVGFDLQKNPQFACAFSCALQGLSPSKREDRLNFRTGEFEFKGELDYLRTRAPTLVAWGVAILLLLALFGGTKNFVLNREQAGSKDARMSACRSILGKKVVSASRCLAMMKEEIGQKGDSDIPEFSAADVYLEIPRVLSSELDVKITELDITENQVRIQGETSTFEDVDKIVEALSRGLCFTNVSKGKARKISYGVGFSVNMKLDCASVDEVNL